MFKNAPMFKRVRAQAKGKNAAVMRQQAAKVRSKLQKEKKFIKILSFLAQIMNNTNNKNKPKIL